MSAVGYRCTCREHGFPCPGCAARIDAHDPDAEVFDVESDNRGTRGQRVFEHAIYGP
jgi:hypothetical protein